MFEFYREKTMQDQLIQQLKSRNHVNQQAKSIKKKIRYLQRELVRASFLGVEKIGLCQKLLKLINQERSKIIALNHKFQ